jgi:hypothetical protein
MPQFDSPQGNFENASMQSFRSLDQPHVDMRNLDEMQSVFGSSNRQESNVISASGHVMFGGGLYDGEDAHLGQAQTYNYMSGDQGSGQHCHHGPDGGGSNQNDGGSIDKQILADLQKLDQELQTISGELAQLLGGTNPGTGSDSGGSGTTTPPGGSDSGGGTTTPPGGSDSGGGTTTPPGGSDSGGGTTTPPGGSDSGGGTTTPPGDTYIPGVTSANNAKLAAANASLVDGQGNGPDALYLASQNSGLASVDPSGNGFSQRYGYFEATVKIENGGSGWPGTWLESLQHATNPNVNPSAEIDFMEAQTGNPNGQGDNSYYATLHSSSGVDGTTPGTSDQTNSNNYITGLPNLTDGYHTFGVDDQPNNPDLEFYLDGKEVASVPKFSDTDNSPMFLNLDNITGGWANAASDTPTGAMQVQSVRVFQDSNLINSSNDPGGTIGTNLSDLNSAEAPPDIPGVNWVNTFNSDFSHGGISASADGATNNTLWTAATPQFPWEPWNLNGVSSGPSS